MQDLEHFFEAAHFIDTHSHLHYNEKQWGSKIQCLAPGNQDWSEADIVILGCGERRGQNPTAIYSDGPDAIRKHLYELYDWHPTVRIADAGNIAQGATLGDTRAALRTVLAEMEAEGKTVILLGGSHDLTMQQYEPFKKNKKIIQAAVTDMLIDLDEEEELTDRGFLMEMLTGTPNYVRHYTHIGFQSYHVNPTILETLDKLRFDFMRLGKVRENMAEAEPALRSANIYSFDMNAIKHADAPANAGGSPNGLTGDEACLLTRYAGMAPALSSLGIFGYHPERDSGEMTARLIAQMIWYFADGFFVRQQEPALSSREDFETFHVTFTDNDTRFLKSKRTGRWWMELPGEQWLPCTHEDYVTAGHNEIPERWLREQER